MPTIHFTETTTSTPDDHGPDHADVTEGSGGIWELSVRVRPGRQPK